MSPQKPGSARLTDAQKAGLALRALRRRYDMSQAAAADLANTRQQTWQRYEAGEVEVLLKPTIQKRLAEALGADHEEFLTELARVNGVASPPRPVTGVPERGMARFEFPVGGRVRAGHQGHHDFDAAAHPETIDLSHFLGPDVRVLRLAGESMVPYAEPGGFVTYNLKSYPRRGQGCVIEMDTGDFYIKRYERVLGSKLQATELYPVERELEFDMEHVRGIYAVGLRGD